VDATRFSLHHCQSTIADAYRSLCGVSCSISLNTPSYYDLDPRPTDARQIRLIHHGSAAPVRQLENMITLVSFLDQRFTLTLMLVSPDRSPYLQKLKRLARIQGDRIEFVPPVAFDQIVPTISRYDIGVYLLPSCTTNLRLALPNKLFEFIQARLAVAVSPNPAMAALVHEHGVGIVSDENTPEAMARILNGLTSKQIDQMRQCSHRAAASLNSDVVVADWRSWVAEAMAS
jgi:glycosyltransferase involved in cell wall biosynthesis